MIEPWTQKLRRYLANPIPRRRSSPVASWIEWGGRCRRVRTRR